MPISVCGWMHCHIHVLLAMATVEARQLGFFRGAALLDEFLEPTDDPHRA